MTPMEHQIAAAVLASSLNSLEGVGKAVVYIHAQMHIAAASGDYIGEARNGGSYAHERRD